MQQNQDQEIITLLAQILNEKATGPDMNFFRRLNIPLNPNPPIHPAPLRAHHKTICSICNCRLAWVWNNRQEGGLCETCENNIFNAIDTLNTN